MFRKNVERESTLFKFWSSGHTVKETALLSGVPEGTISHYFSRFNRDKGKLNLGRDAYKEPPRSSPWDVAAAATIYTNVMNNVNQLMMSGDYSKARDFLQVYLLVMDFDKRMRPIIQNTDPEKYSEVIKNTITIYSLFDKAK